QWRASRVAQTRRSLTEGTKPPNDTKSHRPEPGRTPRPGCGRVAHLREPVGSDLILRRSDVGIRVCVYLHHQRDWRPKLNDMVQVPRHLIEQLARYLESPSEPRVTVLGNGDWTRTMVQDLKREAAQYRGAIATGDLAAQRAGQLVIIDEVLETTGLTRRQVASDLGAFSKASRRLFGKVMWPFRALDSAAGTNYIMQPEIAAWGQES